MVLKSSILKKVIIVSLAGLTALGAFYTIENYLKADILEAVDQLSEPTQKLILVNQLNAELTRFNVWYQESLQKENQINIIQLTRRSDTLFQIADSLKAISVNNTAQIVLIDSIIEVLHIRNQMLYQYYLARQNQSSLIPLSKELSELHDILSTDSLVSSTLIETNTNQISKTRIDTTDKKEKKEGFLSRIFSRKKEPETIVVEEESTYQSSDTTRKMADSASLKKVRKMATTLADKEQQKQVRFEKKEKSFNKIEKDFNQKINNLITAIEREIIFQTNSTQRQASGSIENALQAIHIIILLFVIVSILLIGQIVIDIARNNKYRQMLEVATKQAEQESRSKQLLLSNMSHEIRTPLQSILGYSEQLHKQDPKNPFHPIIHQAAEHLLKVVNEILAYSSLQTGQFHLDKQNFFLQEVLDETKDFISVQAEKKNLELTVYPLIPSDIWIHGDPFRLRQILLNLLSNAVKYTDKGSVSLQTQCEEKEDGWICTFTISDTGSGIATHLHEKIFEQFEQGDADMNQRQSGTGLGLGISKALTQAHGGTINLKSIAGEGSVFTVTISYSKATAAFSEKKQVNEVAATITGEVWIVDDDELILQLCSIILEKQKMGYKVFSSAENMLKALHKETPSILITDIRMPGINGFDLAKKVRDYSNKKISIIAFTANALPYEQEKIMDQGFDAILTKPFREKELLALIRKEGILEIVNRAEQTVPDDGNDGENYKEYEEQIRLQFIKDSEVDSIILNNAIQEKNLETISLLLHRIAGRTMQAGNRQTGLAFRKLEIALNQKKCLFSIDDQNAIENAIMLLQKDVDKLK